MGFLYFLGGLLILIFNFIIAGEFASIADKKGHDGTKYGVYTFFFGIAGMLMVVALPPVYQSEAMKSNTKTANTNKPQKKAVTVQVSPRLQANDEDFVDIKCSNCGETLSVMQGEDTITCPWCDTTLKIKK